MALNDREKWVSARPPWREDGSPFTRYDDLGRKVPRRLGIPDYLLMIAQIEPARVRRVPLVSIVQDGRDDEGEFSFVTCPCGSQPVARPTLVKCPSCERYYVHVEQGSVYVTYGAMSPPPLATAPHDA